VEDIDKSNQLQTADQKIAPGLRDLLGIFYGLAIASGMKRAADVLVDPCHFPAAVHLVLPLSLGALLVGVSDWALFYRLIAEQRYEPRWRIFLDLLFPVIVFCMFYASLWLDVYMGFGCAYFALSAWYIVLMKSQNIKGIPPCALPLASVLAVLLGAGFIVGRCTSDLGATPCASLVWIVGCGTGLSWIVCSGRLIMSAR